MGSRGSRPNFERPTPAEFLSPREPSRALAHSISLHNPHPFIPGPSTCSVLWRILLCSCWSSYVPAGRLAALSLGDTVPGKDEADLNQRRNRSEGASFYLGREEPIGCLLRMAFVSDPAGLRLWPTAAGEEVDPSVTGDFASVIFANSRRDAAQA